MIKEIAVQSAERVGSTNNCRVNDWVIIGVGRHDPWSRAREDNLRNFLRPKIAEVFGYLLVRQPR